ncbi:PREDICTED: DNA fragmentation factor subunit beta isoform X1 [Myotis brandtii]|uniref:DNA fragmentation factor subunit beta isoform X1 n=1 Tax=Myotis brandtii TaxID=109478 RepID=UPI000704655B|nr:PREDICTED: DNA fragmentation factor subunit beta isoform X1 [Myotis brandtii]
MTSGASPTTWSLCCSPRARPGRADVRIVRPRVTRCVIISHRGRADQTQDVSDISRFLSVFHRPHVGVIQAARQLLLDEQAPLRQKLLADLLHTVSENIAAETRAEDPPWFEGLESRFRNKCAYLRFSCASRIRTYLREVGPARRGWGDVGLRCGR